MTTAPANVGLPYRAESARPLEENDLEVFHERHRKDTFWARVALLALIFGILGLNLWMTQRSYDALITDVDASRVAMSELHEQTALRLEAIEARLASIEAKSVVLVAPAPGTPGAPLVP